ncbi:MAG: hypothetical protein PCFJNLEI_04116 [Verrucomicrobiae bacterium]|nr:hypothetical protein [Verrucomicrobiae bacterium]
MGGGGNTVILTNAVIFNTLIPYIGHGSSNNTVTLLADTIWSNQPLYLGMNAATGNVLRVEQGAIITNITTALTVGGGSGASGNSLIATNGRLFMSSGAVSVGANGAAVGGGGNSLILSNSLLTGSANSYIGFGSSNNTLRLLGETRWGLGGFTLTVGAGAATGNVLLVNGAFITNITTLTVGSAAASLQNSVLIENGGLLQANTLTIGGGTGNTISNVNSTFQFNQAAVINSLVAGDIAITDGTISFRGTSAGNVATNAVNQINRIRFAGANTFMLNNASNTAATVRQTYTFDAVPGNPSNYVNLVMVNGTTAYRNANGADITIGNAGSFVASNTLATISGTFTNNGLADIVDATVEYQSALAVAGTMTLRNGFVTGSATKTIAGTLRGNGSVVGDMTITGDLSPGLSLGTLVFSNSLTLAGSYQAEFGDGGNDQLIVVGDLTLSGATLDLTAVGGLTGAAYVIASYGDLFGTFSVTNGMPVGYTLDYNYTGANQIAIVVVPEPGALGLVGLGLFALIVVSRRRRR